MIIKEDLSKFEVPLESLPVHPVSLNGLEILNQDGGSGVILKLSPERVAKVLYWHMNIRRLRNDTLAVCLLNKQFQYSRELFERGVCVPQPKGFFGFSNGRAIYPGFEMEFVHGEALSDLQKRDARLYRHARQLYLQEAEKAIRLGFEISDGGNINSVYSAEQDRTFLIDYETWRRR